MIKWLLRLILLGVVIFVVYVNNLDNIVKAEFSKSSDYSHSDLELYEHPKILINMLLLMEDQSYFNHSGVDFKEVVKVLRDSIFFDKPIRGASTITQQLIKNSLLTKQRTLKRKFNEALMALLLEHAFDKVFILTRYMNSVYLGQHGNRAIYGFKQGAQFYFHKPLKSLSTNELAILVALVRGPSFYHPIKHPQRLERRKQLVLSTYKKYKKIVK